jgi:hypothetical protein
MRKLPSWRTTAGADQRDAGHHVQGLAQDVDVPVRARAGREPEPTLYRRYLTIFLDGMRADPGPLTVLPVAALSTEQTHAIMTPGSADGALTR